MECNRIIAATLFVLLAAGGAGVSCKGGAGEARPGGPTAAAPKEPAKPAQVTLRLGSYTVNKDVFQKELIPGFQKHWAATTGQAVKFEESYQASGAQSRAIVAGFEADVAALSLEEDIERIQEAGLITHDWHTEPHGGFVSNSVIVLAVRSGNPKKIKGWEDLARADVDVLYPNPKTSGGAMWCVNAIWGAGLKESEKKKGAPDTAFATDLLKKVQKRVKVMDKSGRESVTTFERGIGDVAVTYENEVLLRQKDGVAMDFVIPDATILIQNPATVVDVYAEKHGVVEAAKALVAYLHGEEAQRAYAAYGFRPVTPEIAASVAAKYPAPPMLFDISYLGGWAGVRETIYGEKGVWTTIMQQLAAQK